MSACVVAMYHYVRDTAASPFPAINALGVQDFERQLDVLAAVAAPIDCDELARRCASKSPLVEPSFLLTFDDGFVDHYEIVFPRLAARGLRGVFFLAGDTLGEHPRMLNVHRVHFLAAHLGVARLSELVLDAAAPALAPGGTRRARLDAEYRYDDSGPADVKHLLNYILPFDVADRVLSQLFESHLGDETEFARGLYVSEAMVREMAAAGMTFGYHTASHRVLSRLDAAGQRAELDRGVARIRALTGQTSVPFCYPYGHPHTYTTETPALLAEMGYSCAFNTERRLARPEVDPCHAIPRYDTRDLPPFTSHMPHA